MKLDGRVALITAAEESVVPSLVPSFEKAPHVVIPTRVPR